MQDQKAINILKGLVIDGVHKAASGHPGGAMGSMDLAYLLFTEYLRFDPDDPNWQGRDRFILSAGHMSMLQYVMLYGIGWLTMDDLKAFRQWGSRTPGHPENHVTPGVECTTGPLGQGAAMSVGFAIAAQHFKATLDEELFDYETFVLVSDGDLQEGVALAAASLAGHLKLGNLTWIYDSNKVQLSGPTDKTMSDEVESVFGGMGWRVHRINGYDHKAIRRAFDLARAESAAPTLIVADTTIGKGCVSMEGSFETHGSPLPKDERAQTKANLGLPNEDFYAPEEFLEHFRRNFKARRDEVKTWRARLEARMADADFVRRFKACFERRDYSDLSPVTWGKGKEVATRNAFGDIIEKWAHEIPNLFGGSADLEPSNMTKAFAVAVGDFDGKNRKGRNLNFGVREFPMSAICNGMALHGGLVPFDATFLSFADYSRPALRLGALQKVRVIHEFTHDSFYLGEDGPTHQPIEQVMSLRLIPDLYVMRPADANETEVLMRKALSLELPSALCLTRQKLPQLELPRDVIAQAARGAYVVKDPAGNTPFDMILIATGSEVSLALEVAALLGDKVRVVSMPCWELFEEQDKHYQELVLPSSCARRVSLEAGVRLGWERWIGAKGLAIGIDHFGASAPAGRLAEEYGFTPAKVLEKIRAHDFG